MKNFFFGVLTVLVIGVIGFFSYQYGRNSLSPDNKNHPSPILTQVLSPTLETTPNEVVGNDRDEHGCIGSAGYTWCEVKKKCLRTWEEPCSAEPTPDDLKLIEQAFVKKYNWNIDEMIITVSKNDGKYASGGVKDKNAEAGGGYFFAAKVGDHWEIVADGNGTIECSSLLPYPDFPNTLIPECYDSSTNTLRQRD